jgi:hypothetical protein
MNRRRPSSLFRGCLITVAVLTVLGVGPPRARAEEDTQVDPYFSLPLPPGVARDEVGFAYIANIRKLIDSCPSEDYATGVILSNLELRRNGVPVTDFTCTSPVSAMPDGALTNELAAMQVLRTIWWMDQGRTGHLPWTSGTLYNWMRTRVNGFDLRDDTVYSYCCENYGGKIFVIVKADTPDDLPFRRTWRGIRFALELYAHEARHRDNYPHISCPTDAAADDMNFDVNHLTTRGVQWWLAKLFLDGTVNVGGACNLEDYADILRWGESDVDVYRDRFCNIQPPLVTLPAFPHGKCTPAVTEAVVAARVLTLKGWNFKSTSVIFVDGKPILTKKIGKTLTAGVSKAVVPRATPVTIKVRNKGKVFSPGFVFTR